MNFDWLQYYDLAKELSGWPQVVIAQGEAKLRSAISRAYYAAFCEARNYLIDKGHNLDTSKDVHKDVRQIFATGTDSISKDIAENLDALRHIRNLADYEEQVRAIEERTKEALRRCNAILHQLTKLK
jgi:uncharacterized protein (UPF0332 family)